MLGKLFWVGDGRKGSTSSPDSSTEEHKHLDEKLWYVVTKRANDADGEQHAKPSPSYFADVFHDGILQITFKKLDVGRFVNHATTLGIV
ncbi:MAG: hypothetical protein SNJ67_09215 [Chloracidobacterium sp.]|uniref:Uncharacterized protein n=1 Tax=Chloracidobacterium validum TaxID=2821543 RepID=A0ABX8B7P9_9BACT|nr:hypothetical protein [Chloracidobacterium validum]QUW02686.1 hypothetical protein J8C06_10130 [Chloracidobacterium validum]